MIKDISKILKEKENFPVGVPGCETMLPLLLDAVNRKKISLKK